MRIKSRYVVGILVLLFAVSTAHAKEGREKSMMGEKDGSHHMMKKKHKSSAIAVTPDGGVVVLMGHKLLKFDSDLNLQKKVSLKEVLGYGKKEESSHSDEETEASE